MSIEALAGDYLSAGGKMIGGSVLKKLLEKRAAAARDILIDRLAKGKEKLKDLPEDDAAAIIYRYMRAAEEGAARLNLKLLADVIAGQDAKPGFYANDFLLWADILSGLRREEILLLGIMHREARAINYKLEGDEKPKFWHHCKTKLELERGIPTAEIDRIGGALLRTGLLDFLSGLYGGGQAFLPSTRLQKLAEMADLESYYMEEPYVG